MAKALIKLAYRQVIDASSTGDFEKKVFHDSYAEFLMKVQAYIPENTIDRYSEIVNRDGRANSLHYKCSFAVLHHIDTLQHKVPGWQDTAGRMNIPFEIPEFKVLESSIKNKALHKVAIIYITDTFTLVESFGEYLVLSLLSPRALAAGRTAETFTVKMQPEISVIRYQGITSGETVSFSEA